jgi:hypothetical protein
MGEAMVASLRDYEHSNMNERSKVAMRLVDAFILGFGKVPPELSREAHAFFTDAELTEIGLTVFTCSTNKILVSLGVDDPENVEEAMGIRIHEDFYPPWPPPPPARSIS